MHHAAAAIGRIVALALLCVCILSARADTVSGGATAGWRPWTLGNLDEDGKPYWDTPSFDGSHESIGFILTSQSPTPVSGAPGAIPFWGQSYNSGTDTGGGSDANFFFNRTAPSTTATFKLEISARSGINQFGWYDVTNTPILYPIFTGSDTTGAQQTIGLPQQYGFYIKTSGGSVFRTQSSLNPAGELAHQHFAVFQESSASMAEVYWLGIEDLTVTELGGGEGGIGDYNDMVIRLVAVPEASTSILLLAGLTLTFGLIARAKRVL